MDSSGDSKAEPIVTSLPQSSESNQTVSREKTGSGIFHPGLAGASASYVIPTSSLQLEELLKHGYPPQLVFQWQLTQLARQQYSDYSKRMMEGSSQDQHLLEQESARNELENFQKAAAWAEEGSVKVKTEPDDPDDVDDDEGTEQSNGYPEMKLHEKQEITSNQVKQRLQEFVLNKQQREAAVAGVPDPNMFKRWNLSVSGDNEQDRISPLTRPRSSNGDSNFPLRKTASEPNLKAKSKLRAKVSEHRSYLGSVVVPRRRDRNGSRVPKSASGVAAMLVKMK